MKKQLFFGLIISSVCLYFAMKGLSFRDIALALRQADVRWIVAACLVFVSGYAFRALRWNRLLATSKSISPGILWRPLVIGFFANNILPFRAGEVVRAHLAGRLFGLSRITTFSSIFFERLLDMTCLLLAFQFATLFFTFPEAIRRGSQIGTGAIIVGWLALWSLVIHQRRCDVILNRMPLSEKWIFHIRNFLSRFLEGSATIRHPRYLFPAALLSVCVWCSEGTYLYCLMRAFDLPLPYASAYFLLFFIGLSVALPQAPGYVGTLEFFGTMALGILGISKELALPVKLALHGLQFALVVGVGLIALSAEGLSFKQLLKEGRPA